MGAAVAIRLRALDAADAALANAVAAGRRARVDIGGTGVDVELVDDGCTALDDASGMSLCLDTAFGPVELRPGAPIMRLLTGVELPGLDEADEDMRLLAAQAAATRLPAGWRRLFGLVAVQHGVAAPEGASVTLRLREPGQRWLLAGRLRARATVLQALACAAPWKAVDPPQALPEDRLFVRRPVAIGSARLALRELRALAPGDVVVPDRALFDADGAGAVRLGCLCLHGVLDAEGGFRFERWSRNMDRPEEDPDAAPSPQADAPRQEDAAPDGGATAAAPDDGPARAAAEEPAPSLDDLPVSVVFEVGTLELSVAALRRLAPGSVVELQRPLPPAVRLRCRGLEVARGELVELEGRLAVQIQQVGMRDE